AHGLRATLAALAAAGALSATGASAAPITYAGHLAGGVTSIGSVDADTGPWDGAAGWQFWTFDAKLFDQVSITVERLDGALDPVIGVWFGQEADTAAYFDMSSDSLASTWMGLGDDELAAFVPGAGGDARVQFTSLFTGRFVVAVADHALTPGGTSSMDYRITMAVPEPSTYMQLAAGLLLMGGLAWTRAKRR
ncbi:MAG: hypothetical protein MK041_11705, partial [Aquabacterium sp.]|nr:hypothetical protein [Aquabacterium sp.]